MIDLNEIGESIAARGRPTELDTAMIALATAEQLKRIADELEHWEATPTMDYVLSHLLVKPQNKAPQ